MLADALSAVRRRPADFVNTAIRPGCSRSRRSVSCNASGEPANLDAAITAIQDALDAAAPDDPNRALCLANLGVMLRARFTHTGELADADAAPTHLNLTRGAQLLLQPDAELTVEP